MQQPADGDATATQPLKQMMTVSGDAIVYTFREKYSGSGDVQGIRDQPKLHYVCVETHGAPVGRHDEFHVYHYFDADGFLAGIKELTKNEAASVLYTCDVRIVARDGSPQPVFRYKQTRSYWPDMKLERMATLEELERADSTLMADDGSVTIEFCVTILRQCDLAFVDLYRPDHRRAWAADGRGSSTEELLHRTGLFSDVTLRAGKREFPVHRAILAVDSPVFRATFESLLSDVDAAKHITVDFDLDADVLEEVLTFVYTGVAPRMSSRSVQLLAAADKFQLAKLQLACLNDSQPVPPPTVDPFPDGDDHTFPASPRPLIPPIVQSILSYHGRTASQYEWHAEPQKRQFAVGIAVDTCSYSCAFSLVDVPLGCFNTIRRTIPAASKFRAPDGAELLGFSLLLGAEDVELTCSVLRESRYNPAHYEARVIGADGETKRRVGLLAIETNSVQLMKTSELLDPDARLISQDRTLTVELTVSFVHRDAAYVDVVGSIPRPGVRFPPGLFSDVTLCVDGRQFPAHRAVLAAESSVFRAMFDASGMKESEQRTVDIEGLSADVVEELITWLYTGDSPNIEALAAELLVVADRYDLPHLKSAAEDALALTLNVQNVVTAFFLAKRYGSSRLRVSTINWIARHVDDVLECQNWADMEVDSLRQSLDTLKWIATNAGADLEWSGEKIATVENYLASEGCAWLENVDPLLALDSLKRVIRRPRGQRDAAESGPEDPIRVFRAFLLIPRD